MEASLSVIICTHNPRMDYLYKVLMALEAQTLLSDKWELLLVDNASDKLLSSEIDLAWHPQARYIREEQLGLTAARIRGIQEAAAEILVFVDDDNVLDPDYLEAALNISKDWSILGAWGGQIIPEFEETPPDWTKSYWWMLAIREFEQDQWSNLSSTLPIGAGMCVRKVVAKKYAELVINNPKRINLDPKGKKLLRAGDSDLAITSWDLGLGAGLFVSLKLTHLIPESRLQEEYLLRLAEGIEYSIIMLEYFRGKMPNSLPWKKKLLEYCKFVLTNPRSRRFHKAIKRGRALAIQEIYNS